MRTASTSDRRLRVLHLTAFWPHEAAPTEAIFVREHVRAAAAYVDSAVVHVAREPAAHGLVDVIHATDPELDVRRVRYRRFPRPFSYVALALGTVAAYRRLIREGFRPDVLHAHQLVGAIAALALGRLYRIPVVYTEHWTIFLPENPFKPSPATRRAAKFAFEHADVVLSVSRAWQNAVEATGVRARFEIVPNVVDTAVFHPSERERAKTPRRLLSIGHFNERAKGTDLLLRAIARLVQDRKALRLDLLGTGEAEAEYRALAADLGLDANVVFHGLRPKEEVAHMLRDADVFVMASRFENSPCSIIEALASGVPVVATRVGGVSELVGTDEGVLAEAGSADAIAAALSSALERLDDFDRPAIAAGAAARFGMEPVGRSLAAVYARLAR